MTTFEKGVDLGVANPTRMSFDLQYFADETETPEAPAAEGSEPEPAAQDNSKAFAARLSQERKKLESEYVPYKSVIERQAKASGMEPSEYLKFLQERQESEELELEADRTGKTPEELRIAKEKAELENKLNSYERKEKLTADEKRLTSDPKIGKFVSENLERIREIAESSGTDLEVSLAIVAAEKLPSILEMTNPDYHIKNYLESLKRGGKPIEIGGGATAPSAIPAKSFEDARNAALEKLKNGG
jgi:hypothetical protein